MPAREDSLILPLINHITDPTIQDVTVAGVTVDDLLVML